MPKRRASARTMCEKKMEEEEERIELGNLYPEIVDSIFSRITLKSLTRFKSVSKSWCNFITRFRHLNPLTTSTGLVVNLKHTDDHLYESIFFKLHDNHHSQGQSCSLYKSFMHKYPFLIDSCKGLLLYASLDNGSWFYHIYNVFLDRFLALPLAHELSRPACASLAFDGFHSDKFRVICFFFEEADAVEGRMNCKIFSSQTWRWQELAATVLNSSLLLEDGFVPGECFLPSVYCRGRSYWLWSTCLLVYDDEKDFFELIRLPRNHQNSQSNPNLYLRKLLWESDGKIQFCSPADKGFYIWTYHGDDELLEEYDVESANGSLIWRLNRFVSLEDLRFRRFKSSVWGKMRMGCAVKPCAFNDDLQLLLLHLSPGTIFAYSVETQKFEMVWSCDDIENNYCVFSTKEDYPIILNICPFQFDSANVFSSSKN